MISLPGTLAGRVRAQSSGADRPALSFGVIADPQYADQPARGTRYYRQSIQKLKDSIKDLNRHDLDFVVTLGDVIDKDFKSFGTIMPLYDALKAPHRLVLGNHDYEVAGEDKKKVTAAMGMEKSHYSEVLNGWRFVYLDGTEVSLYRYPKDDPRHKEAEKMRREVKKNGRPQAHAWNGGIGEGQLAWLKKELDAAQAAKQRVIVFNHYPAWPKGGHNLWDAEEVVRLLSGYDHVAAYMNGHNHQGHYAEHKGCHYVNFKGMVETKDTTAYAVVQCFADRVEIDGLGVEPDRDLSVG